MRLPDPTVDAIWQRLEPIIQRVPDEIIGDQRRWRATEPNALPVRKPFLLRWFVSGRKAHSGEGWGNRYLHQFIRDDEDRALHDHPWWSLGLILGGQYIEHTIDAGGIHKQQMLRAGDMKLRSPSYAHRVALTSQFVATDGTPILGRCPERAPNTPAWVESDPTRCPSWSLFVTGPVRRKWGFHCRDAWKGHKDFSRDGGC